MDNYQAWFDHVQQVSAPEMLTYAEQLHYDKMHKLMMCEVECISQEEFDRWLSGK